MQWLNSLYTRLLIAFISIILPLQVITSAIHIWSRSTIERELTSMAAANVAYLRDTFDENISQIITQMEFLLQNSQVRQLSTHQRAADNASYYMQVKLIQELLYFIKNGNSFIDKLHLYYLPSNIRLTSDLHTYRFSEDEFLSKIQALEAHDSLLTVEDGQFCVTYAYPFPAGEGMRSPLYYIEARLRADRLDNLLSSFDAFNEKNALLIHHATSTIYTSKSSLSTRDLAEIIPSPDALDGDGTHILKTDEFLIIYCPSRGTGCTFAQMLPLTMIYAVPHQLSRYMLVFYLVALVVIAIYILITYRLVNRPIQDLLHALEPVGKGNFDVQITGRYSHEFNMLSQYLNDTLHKIRTLIAEKYENTLRLQQAEFKRLQAQINPHFLYNSLFMLKQYIYFDDNEQSLVLADLLGKYFQYICGNQEEIVDLNTEYQYTRAYIDIQQMRFGAFLRVEAEALPAGAANLRLPRLSLQPVVENALIYGVPAHSECIVIRISFTWESPALLCIRIEDNGDKLTDESLTRIQSQLEAGRLIQEAHALVNTQWRLRMFAGADAGMTASRSALGGLCIALYIPVSEGGTLLE